MSENWLLRVRRRLPTVNRTLAPGSLAFTPGNDADARRVRAEFAAIRARFPDHA